MVRAYMRTLLLAVAMSTTALLHDGGFPGPAAAPIVDRRAWYGHSLRRCTFGSSTGNILILLRSATSEHHGRRAQSLASRLVARQDAGTSDGDGNKSAQETAFALTVVPAVVAHLRNSTIERLLDDDDEQIALVEADCIVRAIGTPQPPTIHPADAAHPARPGSSVHPAARGSRSHDARSLGSQSSPPWGLDRVDSCFPTSPCDDDDSLDGSYTYGEADGAGAVVCTHAGRQPTTTSRGHAPLLSSTPCM